MKLIILFCMAALAFAEDKYESISDNINLDEVLTNDKLLTSYSKCLIDKGPCTPEIKHLKEKLPEALETRCAKCTDKQKQMGKQLVKELKDKHPEIWKELVSHYDPEGKHQQAFEDFIKS
ncbi:unnamed protein product, partial [Brenthis ino]